MSIHVIQTKKAPGAVGPYSQAVQAGHLVFASGQIPIQPESGNIEADDIEGQTEQSMKNVQAILAAAGITFDEVVKTTIYLTDMAYFSTVNDVYGRYFKKSLPARSCVGISKLPKGALVEVEVVAYCER